MNLLKSAVIETIQKHQMIHPGEKVIAAVSGGPDSMVLLYLLHDLREELQCNLHVAHLNHMFRNEESDADADYVLKHAEKLGIPITLETIDVKKLIDTIMPKESLESGARRVRYDFYERVLETVQGDKVALGHNSDDQAETVMMRLLRGAGALGLAGIPPVRGRFIRPLIEISRKEIDEYLREKQITPRYDSSNLDTVYARNKIRLDLLPLLEKEYSSNIKQILQQTGELLRTEDEFLANLAQEAFAECVSFNSTTIIVNIAKFREYHLALQRRVSRLIVREMLGDLWRFDYNHIREILEIVVNGTTGSVIDLPRGISVEKSYDKLIFRLGHRAKNTIEPFAYPVAVPGETNIPEISMLIETAKPETIRDGCKKPHLKNEFQAILDFDAIHGALHVRNRRPGDKFQPLGVSGHKKLKDFFIDQKIPRGMRDSIPILTDEDGIIWVIGYRIDDRVKVTAKTKNRVDICVQEVIVY